jgi:hypothetical protein
MDGVLRRPRLAACLGVTLLAMGCSTVGVSGPGDGTFIGGLPDRFDFNDPSNWSPAGVPTGTATVPVGSGPSAPFISFSAPATALAAVIMQGDLGMTVDTGKSLKLTGPGLTLCCKKARAFIAGELIGNVSIGDASGTVSNQLQGSGTINGSIQQIGGSVTAGSGAAQPTMTVFGTYHLHPMGGLGATVWQGATSLLDVRGTATLEGLLVIYVDDPTTIPAAPFKVLTAGHGVQGKFSQVFVIPDSLKASVTYNSNDVTVTLRK